MADLTQLMAHYCDGEARAFRELYREVAPRLFGYLVKLSSDRSIAEDVLQHTFMKVHRSRSAYIRDADPLPWIYAIAHRTFIDHARQAKRASQTFVRTGPHAEPADAEATEPQDSPDPEIVATTLHALASLPISQRQAVVLLKLEGKTVVEAAEIAGTTVGAMRVRAHRGYAALRVALSADKPVDKDTR